VTGIPTQTSPATGPPAALPVPHRSRWQPLRAGLVDIFYYDYQEFWFRDGRLMLRGNNGTGKSKVLALTLPFLLDADLSPVRVEPDGDRGKKMEWNLLLGGRYDERLGYTWLEFGRRTEDGEHAYFTVGCGLKAVAGRGIADRWYFTTSQRVGADLYLIGSAGTALTRDRLTAGVGEYGMVTQRAETYRRAVDEHLLHLGPDRYSSLVDLLIQLRQPQLSKRPDEGRLSRALSEALPPVDQAVIADIATAFHDLEQQRDELTALKDTRSHVARFGGRYRHYARVAARRQSRELRAAQYAYEQVGRDLSGIREQITAARTAESGAGERLAAVRDELSELAAIREELAGRPELASLEHAERLADTTARTAAKEKGKAGEAERDRGDRAAQYESALGEAARTRRLVEDAAAAAGRASAGAGIATGHGELAATLGLPDGISEPAISSAEQEFAALAERRGQAVAHVLALADTAAEAERVAVAARTRLAELEAERDGAAEARRAAEEAVAAAGAGLVGAWQRYASRVRELDLPHPDETGLAQWAAALDGPNPAEAALRQAATRATQELAAGHARAAASAGEAADALAALEEERRRLEAGETASPPAPYTRSEDARDGRPGAPLWQLTDFADGLGERQRAGLEAALEASGLLDAWVTPDGTLIDPGTHDVLIVTGHVPARGAQPPAASAARPLPAARGAQPLSAVLRPAIDSAGAAASQVTPDVVGAILAAIALVPGDEAGDGEPSLADPAGVPAWVSENGRWRAGPLRGAWAKPAAEYVGAGTREQARRRRLAALTGEITAARQAVTAARQAVAAVEARQSALDADVAAHPTDQELRDAHGKAAGSRETLARAAAKVKQQASRTSEAERAAADAAGERDEAAADLGVPATREELQSAAAAVRAYAEATQKLATELWKHHARLSEAARCAAELERAERDLAGAREAAAQAGQVARDAAARLAALRDAIGATANELRERLDAARHRIAEFKDAEQRLEAAHREQLEKRAGLEGREQQLLANQAKEQDRRDAAVAAFWRFTETGLLMVALPELEIPDGAARSATEQAVKGPAATSSVTGSAGPATALGPAAAEPATPAVRLARQVEQELSDVDDSDEAWRRVQDDIGRRHRELAEALSRHGHHAALNLVDERVVVTIEFQGRDRAPDELISLLGDEVGYRERMLTSRERELIEEHLVNDVASHLQELIGDAEAQVEQMNAELAERPTSTGMRLRLRWEPAPDGPPGLPEARRRLLRQDAELWSPADRAAVGDFLQRQIEAERARNEDGTWQEQLRLALDYRGWHRFVIERFQDGRWRPATGPASGGERVLTVSLPLFAAASAHYRSAHADAPRLVLLDEAFAGVDDDARAKCLGLLATFDLDVVMTSEREWGFYATVPGIATHQLVRRDGIDAVHITTWEWDGTAPRRVEREYAGQAPARVPDGETNGHRPSAPGSALW
jgi:uncharacterized protein (TIGR02680 family)